DLTRPPPPSTSRVTPIRSGATSWTLRAKNAFERPSAIRSRDCPSNAILGGTALGVVSEQARNSGHDRDRADRAGDAAGDDREAQARQRRDRAGLDVPDRRGARHLGELEALHPAAHPVGRPVEEDRGAKNGA